MQWIEKRRTPLFCLILVSVGLFGAGLLWYATQFGVGMANDSQDYVSTARSIVAGRGVMVYNSSGSGDQQWTPLTVFPPMYPALLALSAQVTHQDVVPAAGPLHALLLGINAMLAAGIAYVCTRSLAAAGIVGVISAALLAEMHAHGMSEGAFICFSLAGLWLCAQSLTTAKPIWQWSFLVLSAVFIAAAILTRYAGVSVLLAAALAIVLVSRERMGSRIAQAAVLSFIALVPLIVWTQHLGSVDRATGRTIQFHPPNVQAIKLGLRTVGAWFAPGRFASARVGVGLIAVLIPTALLAIVLSIPKWRRQIPLQPLLTTITIFTVIYVPFVLFSMTWFDALITLTMRILSPMLIPLLVVLVALLLRSAGTSIWIHCPVIALLTLFAIVRLWPILGWAHQVRNDGLDYNTRGWRDSKILARTLALPPDVPIYTNAWDLLYLNGNRTSFNLPGVYQRKLKREVSQEKIDAELVAMRQRLGSAGYIVFFDGVDRTSFLVDEETLKKWLPLERVDQIKDPTSPEGSGSIYRLSASTTTNPASTAP